MKALVIGLGSMGKRRVRLMRAAYPEMEILGVDTRHDRRADAQETFGIESRVTLADAIAWGAECALVCTAPLSHSGIIGDCLTANLNVFTELNLVSDGYRENMVLAKEKGRVLFLSSTFLYRDDVNFLLERICPYPAPLNYTYHVGQYLPDWHPWEAVGDFFVSDKRTGGVRELLAVELPWILRAFGPVDEIVGTRHVSQSTLKLPYPDSSFVTLKHQSGHIGHLLVDVLARVPVRHFEVFGENLQLEWRGKPEALWQAKPDYSGMEQVAPERQAQRVAGYRDFIVEDAYTAEIENFFAVCDGREAPRYSFEQDLETLALIDRIEGSGV